MDSADTTQYEICNYSDGKPRSEPLPFSVAIQRAKNWAGERLVAIRSDDWSQHEFKENGATVVGLQSKDNQIEKLYLVKRVSSRRREGRVQVFACSASKTPPLGASKFWSNAGTALNAPF